MLFLVIMSIRCNHHTKLVLFSLFFLIIPIIFVYSAGEPSIDGSVSNVGYVSATLNIEVTDRGSSDPTTVGYEWGLTNSYGSSSTEDYVVDSVSYSSQFGSSGSGNGQFSLPYVIDIDSNDNIYVGDYALKRVQKFNSSGVYVSQFGSAGSGDGQFNAITGLFVDSNDNVYVADSANHRIQKFDSNGNFILKFGTFGTGNGQLNGPYNLAVDDDGYIYVAEYSGNRVQKFDSSGNYVAKVGSFGIGNGQFNGPIGVAIDSNNDIYISEYSGRRVQKFDSDLNYISQFGSIGTGNGEFAVAFSIDIHPSGDLYVSDQDNERVQIFNSSGVYQDQFGSVGSGNGQFHEDSLRDLAIDSAGNIYVVDSVLARVQKFVLGDLTEYDHNITGLTPGTTYHYRVYATNSNGTTYTSDATFTTENFTDVPDTPQSALELDTTSDTGTIDSDGYTNDSTPTFIGDCNYNETVNIYIDDILVTPSDECSNDSFSITLDRPISLGYHDVKYTLTNNIGESDYSPELTIYIYEGNYECCNISGLTKPHGPNPLYNNKLYVTQYTTNNVAVIDLATNTVVDTLVSDDPVYIDFIFNNKLYIVNNNGYYTPGSVTIYDLDDTSTPLKTLTLGNDTMWMQDVGDYLYAFNRKAFNGPATISVIDKDTDTVVTTITVGDGANRGTLAPNGKFYVSNHHDSTVSVVDVSTSTVVDTITVDTSLQAFGPSSSLLVGTKIYVANWDAATVGVIDTNTDTLIETIATNGDVASSLGYHNGLLYVNGRHNPNVTVIDTNTDTVVSTFQIIAGGYGMTVVDDKIFFVNQDSEFVSVYNPTTQQVLKHIIVGDGPHSINVVGNCLYVNNFDVGSISIIDTNNLAPSANCSPYPETLGNNTGFSYLYALLNSVLKNYKNKDIIPLNNDIKKDCPVFNQYLKFGDKNPEVRLWQEFLNKNLNKKIPTTGYFGPLTLNAVKEYQNKYFDKILKPWGLTKPTGRIYQTTRYYANLDLGCSEGDLVLDNGRTIKLSN